MKILQIATFYPALIEDFYQKNQHWIQSDYQSHSLFFHKSCVGLHRYPLELGAIGWETLFSVPNNLQLQMRWCHENGQRFPTGASWAADVLRMQIEFWKPDIIHCMDPIAYDAKFFRTVRHKPEITVGWRSASIPAEADFSCYNLILSSDQGLRETVLRQGGKNFKILHPAVPTDLYEAVKDVQPDTDVVFTGQWTGEHKIRNQMLLEVAKAPLGANGEFEIEYYLSCGAPQQLPGAVSMLNRGPVWGKEMLKVLRRGRIVLNAIIDHSLVPSFNLRLFECLGVGAFQLAPHTPALSEFFDIGSEIATYTSNEDLIDKIYYFLKNPAERNEIAQRGFQRCMREHSSRVRVAQYLEIIKRIV